MRPAVVICLALLVAVALGCVQQECLAVSTTCNPALANTPQSRSCRDKAECCALGFCFGTSCSTQNPRSSCVSDADCASFLAISHCNQQSGTCEVLYANGSPCTTLAGGTTCMSGICESVNKKTKRCTALGIGETCDPVYDACAFGTFCDAVTKQCRNQLAIGAIYNNSLPGFEEYEYFNNGPCLSHLCVRLEDGVSCQCADPFTLASPSTCNTPLQCGPGLTCNSTLTSTGICQNLPAKTLCGNVTADCLEAGGVCVCDYSSDAATPDNTPDVCAVSLPSTGCNGDLVALRACADKGKCVQLTAREEDGCLQNRCNKELRAYLTCAGEEQYISPTCTRLVDEYYEEFAKDTNTDKAKEWLTEKNAGVPNWGWIVIGVGALAICIILTVVLSVLIWRVNECRKNDY